MIADAVSQLKQLGNFRVVSFYNLVPAEKATFVTSFFTVLEFGLTLATELCKRRSRTFREDFEVVGTRVNAYMRLHFTTLPY